MKLFISLCKILITCSRFIGVAMPLVASGPEGTASFSIEAFRNRTKKPLPEHVYKALAQYKDTFHTVDHYYIYKNRKYTKANGIPLLVLTFFVLWGSLLFDVHFIEKILGGPSPVFVRELLDALRICLFVGFLAACFSYRWIIRWVHSRRLQKRMEESEKLPGAVFLTDNALIAVSSKKGVVVTEVYPYQSIRGVRGAVDYAIGRLGKAVDVNSRRRNVLYSSLDGGISQDELEGRQALISLHNALIKKVVFAIDIQESMIFMTPYTKKGSPNMNRYKLEYMLIRLKNSHYPPAVSLSELVDEQGRAIRVENIGSRLVDTRAPFVIFKGIRWLDVLYFPNNFTLLELFREFVETYLPRTVQEEEDPTQVYAILSQKEPTQSQHSTST